MGSHKKKPPLKNRKFLIIFSLPFVAVSVGFLFFGIIPSIWEGITMKNWEQGYAHLSSAGYHENDGDDSTTYLAYATYEYEFNGQRYFGDRVAINTTADNIGTFHQDLGSRLTRALEEGEPVKVWINSANPKDAILNHDIRWGLLVFELVFVAMFGGSGTVMLVAGLRLSNNKVSKRKLKNVDAHSQPWLTEKQWASKSISSDAKSGTLLIWVFAIFWNIVSVPSAVLVTPDILKGEYGAAFVYLFPIVGLGLLAAAINKTLNWRRFGRTPFAMDPYPGSIGGQVGGVFLVKLLFDSATAFKATLSCFNSYMTGSGDDRRRTEKLIWQSQGFAHAKAIIGGSRVEVLFNVDKDLPSSESKDSSQHHLWRLTVRADIPGVDFNRSWELPVFPTARPSKFIRALSTEHHQAIEYRTNEIEEILNLEQVAGGFTLFYPILHRPLGKLIGLIIGLIILGIGAGIHVSEGAGILTTIFEGLGLLITLPTFYGLLSSTFIRVDGQGVLVRKTFLGIPTRNKLTPKSSIEEFEMKKSYSHSVGGKHTQFFNVVLETHGGKEIPIAKSLPGQEVAKQAMESLAMLSGLPWDKD